jgi:hypothetical protein
MIKVDSVMKRIIIGQYRAVLDVKLGDLEEK